MHWFIVFICDSSLHAVISIALYVLYSCISLLVGRIALWLIFNTCYTIKKQRQINNIILVSCIFII